MQSGIARALMAALLFGASTPLAKRLLGEVSAVALAGLFYLGSGVGLSCFLLFRRIARGPKATSGKPDDGQMPGTRRQPAEWPWLAGAILSGGVVAPLLLMTGLAQTSAAQASLLLNLEAVLTAGIAWIVFGEPANRRVVWGMGLIVLAGVLLAAPTHSAGAWTGWQAGDFWIALACFGWAVDNNLTRKVASLDATAIAAIKGLVAGTVNLALARHLGQALPTWPVAAQAALIGFFSYGASLVLFINALRRLGTARTAAWFSAAPFAGALLSIAILRETPAGLFWVALVLMLIGLWLHLTEHHTHWHLHERMLHAHAHRHDDHHQHAHDFPWDGTEPHSHPHVHAEMGHAHPHMPDSHHQHRH